MGDVQFDEPQYGSRMKSGSGPSKLAGFVIGLGLAKDNAGAQKVLLVALVGIVLVTAGLFALSGGKEPAPATPADSTWPR